jgi:diaminopropionate ammonia-lyase
LSALLIQDTSWDGYKEIPSWIVGGYTTTLAEIDDQIADDDTDPQATHTVVPVGVGSLAQAVRQHYRSASSAGPRVISVEPARASYVAKSLLAALMSRRVSPRSAAARLGLNAGSARWSGRSTSGVGS